MQASYLNALLRKNIFPEFMQRYLDRNRAAWNGIIRSSHRSRAVRSSNEMYEELIGLGLEQGVTPPAGRFRCRSEGPGACSKHCWQSGFRPGAQLRILHARDDADFIRALNLLKNWGRPEGLPLLEAQHERQ